MLATILTLHTLASKVAEAPLSTEELPKELPTEQPKVVPKPWEPATSLPEGIKHLEGIVRKGGMHRVYDDENKNYVWDGVTPYKQWAKGLTGKPTVGHGNRFEYLSEDTRNKIIAAGGATDTLADQAMIDHLKWQEPILRKRFPDHWDKLTQDNRNALRSLFYSTGPYAKADSIETAINEGNYDKVKDLFSKFNIWKGKYSYAHALRRAREADWYEGKLKSDRIIPIPGKYSLDEPNTYMINKGDTLGAIAQKNNTNLKTLLKLNPGLKPKNLQLGQVIKLPPPPATLQDVINNQPIQDVGKPSKNTYTIKAGDTLSHIAKALGISWQDIQSVNPTLNPNRLKIGQTIQLPDSKQPTKPYTIAEGDTLSGIAQRHNTTWQNIAKLNPGINPNRIKPNQQINVPSK